MMRHLTACVISIFLCSSHAFATDGILYSNVTASPNPFSPNGSNSMQFSIVWGIDTSCRINPLTGTQTDNFNVVSNLVLNLSGQVIRTISNAEVGVTGPVANQTVYWDGRDSVGNLAPEGEYNWVLTGHLVDLSPPSISNVVPSEGSNIAETTAIKVTGHVNDVNAIVTVNGETATVSSSTGTWTVNIPVSYGINTLTIRAKDPSNNLLTQTIHINVGTALGYDAGLLTASLHDPSFERSLQKWTYTSTGSTYGSTTDTSFDGSKTFRSTSLTTAFSGRALQSEFVTGIVAGHSHRLEIGWFSSGSEWADNRLEINIEWYNSSDSLISTSTAADLTLSAQSSWNLKTLTATSPAGAEKAKVLIRWRRTNSTTTGRQQSFDRIALLDLDYVPALPNAPTLLSPISQSETQNIFPVFSWQHNDTSSAPQVKYNIQVSSNADFSPLLHEETAVTFTTTMRMPTPLPSPSEASFYWRIRTSSNNNYFSAFSDTGSFRLNNCIANPSFEDWTGALIGDTAEYWTKLNSTSNDYVRQTNNVLLSGANGLLIKYPTTSFGRGVETRREDYNLSVTPDSGYRLGVWARKNNVQLIPGDYQIRLQMDWFTSGDSLLSTSSYERAFTAFDVWELIMSDTFIAPPGSSKGQYRIQAMRSGGSGLTSDEIYFDDVFVKSFFVAVVAPSAPTNLVTTPGINHVMITWDSSTEGTRFLSRYRLYRGTSSNVLSEIAVCSLSPRAYTDTAVDAGTTYFYAVRAEDAAGLLSDTSNISAASPLPYVPPGVPQNVVAVPAIEQITVSWDTATAGTNPLFHYRICRGTDSNTLSLLAIVSITPRSYTDSAVQVGITYYYAILAEDTADVIGDTSVITAASPLPQPPSDTKIIISEIMFDPIGDEPQNEWIELHNLSTDTVSIAYWKVSDGEGTFTVPPGVNIAPHAYCTLGSSSDAAGGQLDLVYGESTIGTLYLANSGEQVLLFDPLGNIVDSVNFLASWAGEVGQTENSNRSLERKSFVLPSSDRRTWGRSANESGTPRNQNSVDTIPPRLVHSPRPATLEGHDLVIHAYVSDVSSPTILSRTTLYWRPTGGSSYSPATMVKIQTAHSFILTANSIPAAGVEYYIEAEDDANNLARVGSETAPYSVPRIADNRPGVRISEIMYDPGSLSDPDGEWVELVNLDDVPVDISGWIFTDSQSPAAEEGKFKVPAGIVIPAGEFLVLGHSTVAAGGLSDTLYGASSQGTINLLNSYAIISDQIILVDTAGIVVDEANYSSEWGANNGTNSADLTLERVNYDSSANLQSSWRVSGSNGGSPGVANGAGFASIMSISNTMINPNLNQNSSIVIKLDRTAVVSLYLTDSSGARIRTLYDSIARPAGVETVAWDGRNASGLIAWGVAQVVLVAADDSGRVSVDQGDNRVGLVLDEAWVTPEGYNPFFNTRTIHTNLVTKPLFLASRLDDTHGVVRRILFSGNIGEGPQAFIWDGRDDTGSIVKEQLYSRQTINQLPGRVILVDEIPIVDGQVSPLTFAAHRGEVAMIRGTSSINGRLDAWISETRETGLVALRTLAVDSAVSAGEFSLVWDGKDDSGNLVIENQVSVTDYYTIILKLRSTSTGRSSTSFLSVRNKQSGISSFDVPSRSLAVIVNDSDFVNIYQNGVACGLGKSTPLGGAIEYQVPIDTAPRGASRIRVDILPRTGSSYFEEHEMGINEASISSNRDSLSILSGETVIITVSLAAPDTITLIASWQDPVQGFYIPAAKIFEGFVDSGTHQFVWNGLNSAGMQSQHGLYRITVNHLYPAADDILNFVTSYGSSFLEIVE